MVEHLLMGLFGVLRLIDAYQFYFGEFMQAVKPANVFTVRTGLAAETLRIGAILYRQLFLVKDDVPVDIGHRHLSGRYQVQVVYFTMIHLALFVWQLPCSVTGSGIYHCWRHDFRVSRIACFVQEEVDKRALQPCPFAFIDGEACPGDFYS